MISSNQAFIWPVLCLCLLLNGCTSQQTKALESNHPLGGSTVEEARVATALDSLALPAEQIRAQAQADVETILATPSEEIAIRVGDRSWQRAVQQLQAGQLDDRTLYWSRLATTKQLRADCHQPACPNLLAAYERSSRSIDHTQFTRSEGIRILVTGFDPFALDRDLAQSNPSGVLALQLDNRTLTNKTTGQQAQIQSLILPVRFADFDAGIVEQALTPLLITNSVDAIITLSMGRDGFDLERFPGRRRATTAPDNLNRQTGASATNPLAPTLNGAALQGPEFVEFNLPVHALMQVQQPYPVQDNRKIRTLEDGELTAATLSSLTTKTAVAGSGGSYLSNEVSYRSILLSQAFNKRLPIGHIHLPRLIGHNKTTLERISNQLQAMLVQAIPALSESVGRDAPDSN